MSGLPGTSGFVGEFLTLLGTFKVNIPVATLATLGVILSAAYALWLYRKVIFGKLEKPKLLDIQDLDWREIVILAPLVFFTILFGVCPKPVLDMSQASVDGAGRAIQSGDRRQEGRRSAADAGAVKWRRPLNSPHCCRRCRK